MTLNEAILKVISTQYKKDAKEAHQIVEDAGYTISKNYGCYYVRNPKTHRYVCLEHKDGRYYKDYYDLNWGSMAHGNKRFNDPKDAAVFDFVNMLNKPYNRDGNPTPYTDTWNKSKAIESYSELKSLKRNIIQEENDIKSILSQIDTLQKKLIRATETKVKCAAKLDDFRKQCGLNKGGN